MNRQMTAAALVCAVALGLVVVAAAGVAAPASATDAGGELSVVEELDPDVVSMEVDVAADGDAEWTVTYRTRLETDDDEAAFESFREDVEANPDEYTAEFEERMSATAENAAESTGREMTVSGTTVSTDREELPREYGVVTYSFSWTNFAAVDGDRLTIGDAVDGLFLDDASELRIGWPDGYGLVEANPTPDLTRTNGVIWQGPTSFAAGEPRVIADADATGTPDDGGDGADDGGTDGDGSGDGTDDPASDGVLTATTVMLLLVLLAVGAAAAYTRRSGAALPLIGSPGHDGESGEKSDEAGTAATAAGAGAAGAAAAGAATGDDRDGEESASADPAAADASSTATAEGEDDAEPGDDTEDAGDDADDTSETGDDGTPAVDPALLSNEEQVLQLIRENGGRMKQKQVAEELDWTAAKTSQVTKGLREDGDLEGFRLGRENVLALPEADPR